jgi:uncharacterized cupredoxin-like copper-binding protein
MKLRARVSTLAFVPLAALGTLTFAGSPPAGASAKTTAVKAVETDFHIALSKKTFAPGKYTFTVQNKGQTVHSLMITGPGLKNAMTPDIAPGKSAKLTVTFKKGKYDVYCPVPDHKALGMNVNLVISASSSSSSSSSGGSSGTGTGGAGF